MANDLTDSNNSLHDLFYSKSGDDISWLVGKLTAGIALTKPERDIALTILREHAEQRERIAQLEAQLLEAQSEASELTILDIFGTFRQAGINTKEDLQKAHDEWRRTHGKDTTE